MSESNYVFLVCFFPIILFAFYMIRNFYILKKQMKLLEKDETKI